MGHLPAFQRGPKHTVLEDWVRECGNVYRIRLGLNWFVVSADPDLNAEKRIIKDQVEEDVRKLIEELPEDQRDVLVMRVYKDMSFREIAERTDVSINTALGRMRYALINLRKVIEKNNIVLTN